ncbi:hypothetical protein L1887_47783 [Cichorium endivia]|nr:hypothetical protein L1887_47783 [Cichorium endivia]
MHVKCVRWQGRGKGYRVEALVGTDRAGLGGELGLDSLAVVAKHLLTGDLLDVVAVLGLLGLLLTVRLDPEPLPVSGSGDLFAFGLGDVPESALLLLACGIGLTDDTRLFDRLEADIVVEEGKVEDAETGVVGLVGRRGHDTVDGLLEVSARDKVHRIAQVDDERIVAVLDQPPLVIGHEHLERSDRLAPQDRDRVEVRMALQSHPTELVVVLLVGGVVHGVSEQIQAALLGLLAQLPQMIRRQLEYERQHAQDLAQDHRMVESCKLLDLRQQMLDRRRKELLALLGAKTLRPKVELLDTVLDAVELPVSLLLVADKGAGGEDVGLVLCLVRLRDAVEGILANGELTQHVLPRQPVVLGIDEAVAREGLAHLAHHRLGHRGEVVSADLRKVERVFASDNDDQPSQSGKHTISSRAGAHRRSTVSAAGGVPLGGRAGRTNRRSKSPHRPHGARYLTCLGVRKHAIHTPSHKRAHLTPPRFEDPPPDFQIFSIGIEADGIGLDFSPTPAKPPLVKPSILAKLNCGRLLLQMPQDALV